MSSEIRVPLLPESVTEATVLEWHCAVGDVVQRDTILLELETDKVVLEVPAPETGRLVEIRADSGEIVNSNDVLGLFEGTDSTMPVPPDPPPAEKADTPAPAATQSPQSKAPAVSKAPAPEPIQAAVSKPISSHTDGQRTIQRRPMSRLRQTIANRLMQAQQSAAILSTFNEVDLTDVMALRRRYGEPFEARYGIRLGYMSFFVRACVDALRAFPLVNAQIEDNDIIYHDYFDIGIAVSSPRGLVVPVLRDANIKSFAEIEQEIAAFGEKAKSGDLAMDDLTGGTFTITNGGVFGSLLSTPILNPPQSGILGMHKIQQRPVAVDGQVEIRPMMYIALSYDHRLIDGRDAVGFLVDVKKALEDPARLLLRV